MLTKTSDLFGKDTMVRDALFNGDDQRLTLTRSWGPGPRACFIGCNPSRAGKDRDDPTAHWWIKWCQALSFGGYVGVNMYPFITSSPAECRKIADWENNGPDWYARDSIQNNLNVVVREAKASDLVVACWGNIAWDEIWIDHVVEEIQTGVAPWPDIYCFALTKGGAPMHPMARGKHRLVPNVEPKLWKAGTPSIEGGAA